MKTLTIEEIIERLQEWKQDALTDLTSEWATEKDKRIASEKHQFLSSAIGNLEAVKQLNNS